MINEVSLLFLYEFQRKLGWGRYHFPRAGVNKWSRLKKRRCRNRNPFQKDAFYHRGQKRKSILGAHHIITWFRNVAAFTHSHLKILTSLNSAVLDPFMQMSNRQALTGFLCLQTKPQCIFSPKPVFHFLSFSLSSHDSPLHSPSFRTHPVSHNPSL